MKNKILYILCLAVANCLRASDTFFLQSDTTVADSLKKATKELPLEPSRKLEFTTDEGTWTSLDVSPDGTTIVFDHLGDLYTIPITGGIAKRLTSGMAFDTHPRFSPDGKLVAYISDKSGGENLWTIALEDDEEKQELCIS